VKHDIRSCYVYDSVLETPDAVCLLLLMTVFFHTGTIQ